MSLELADSLSENLMAISQHRCYILFGEKRGKGYTVPAPGLWTHSSYWLLVFSSFLSLADD